MALLRTVALLAIALAISCSQADTPTPLPNTPTPSPTAVPSPTPIPVIPTPQRVAFDPAATPEYCPPAELDEVQDYSKTPASPYFVHHPTITTADTPMIVFLPTGQGRRRHAERVWDRFFADADDVDNYLVVLPYDEDFEFIDDVDRTLRIMDEVFACYGGDWQTVHLAGASTGGLAAFGLALSNAELFVSVLGAPGALPSISFEDLARWAPRFAGLRVFNGVGETDDSWIPEVFDVHEAMVNAGVDSVYMEFPGQGHIVSKDFDENLFFEFWGAD